MNSQTEANLNQVAGDVHLLTAPIRFLFHDRFGRRVNETCRN